MKKWERKIIEWLATGETGISSEAIAFQALGVSSEGRWGRTHPSDPADLRRCVLMLQRCPEAKPALSKLADKSAAWRGLVKEWPALVRLLKKEIGEDLPSFGWSAPKTYGAMKMAIGLFDQGHLRKHE